MRKCKFGTTLNDDEMCSAELELQAADNRSHPWGQADHFHFKGRMIRDLNDSVSDMNKALLHGPAAVGMGYLVKGWGDDGFTMAFYYVPDSGGIFRTMEEDAAALVFRGGTLVLGSDWKEVDYAKMKKDSRDAFTREIVKVKPEYQLLMDDVGERW